VAHAPWLARCLLCPGQPCAHAFSPNNPQVACQAGAWPVAKLLLQKGKASAAAAGKDSWTPLREWASVPRCAHSAKQECVRVPQSHVVHSARWGRVWGACWGPAAACAPLADLCSCAGSAHGCQDCRGEGGSRQDKLQALSLAPRPCPPTHQAMPYSPAVASPTHQCPGPQPATDFCAQNKAAILGALEVAELLLAAGAPAAQRLCTHTYGWPMPYFALNEYGMCAAHTVVSFRKYSGLILQRTDSANPTCQHNAGASGRCPLPVHGGLSGQCGGGWGTWIPSPLAPCRDVCPQPT